ncbi:porin [Hydrogenothermus marinus]|uniref:Phosphate-selective porin O/P n=1 Tax=Hydrogenothermus marinus TaxID=133270 RepID=A0A3M0BFP7_9AQUI|nr:porin [Hydrogenothermus marinus]RMA96140.1 phosphate-selective porin O/P [Hydrogenothermus marinus]
MKKVVASALVGLGAAALFNAPSANAAPTFYFGDGKKLTIFQMVQVWNVYTLKNDPFNKDIDARNDIYIRRGRIGVKGKLRKDISFKVWFAYDNLGKNEASASTGTANANSAHENREFYIWDALWTWHLDPEWANISIGYFRPQVGRESITTAFKVISFQKALTNFDVRKHIVGRGPGRETGINIGGLALNKQLNYNFGIFDTNSTKIVKDIGGKSDKVGDGKKWSPLFAVRVAWSFRDPEHKKYKMGYTQTYYGKRNGVTVGLNYTYQGETDVFKSNSLRGVDLLANFGPVDFVAEYDWLYRKLQTGESGTDTVWSVKAGYNIKLANGQIVRPSVMASKEDIDKEDPNNAKESLTGPAIKQEVYEISLNWLINKDKFKLNLSYDWGKKKDKDFSYIGVGFQFIY